MKKFMAVALGLALTAGLAACGQQNEASKSPESPPTPSDGAAAGAVTPVKTRHGKGVGTVTAIDAASGQVTLDHGAIAAIDWPAMTMGFAAKPGLLAEIKVGDKVAFELDWDGKAGTITQIAKAP